MSSKPVAVVVLYVLEDKDEVAAPLALALEGLDLALSVEHLEVQSGDRLRAKVAHALRRSKFVVAVLSPAFFSKGWLPADVDGMLGYEVWVQEAVLPLRHGLSAPRLVELHPSMADRIQLDTGAGVSAAAALIAKRVFGLQDGRRAANGPVPETTTSILRTLAGLERRALACFNRTMEIEDPNPSVSADATIAAHIASHREYHAVDTAIAECATRALGRPPAANDWMSHWDRLTLLEQTGGEPKTARAGFQNQLEWIRLSRAFIASLGEA